MNKIVIEHVKASEVPKHWRQGINASALVTVIVEEETRRQTREELRALMEEARKNALGVTTEEAVSRIRALRDEWDD